MLCVCGGGGGGGGGCFLEEQCNAAHSDPGVHCKE